MKYIIAVVLLLSSCKTFTEHNTTLSFPTTEPKVITIHKLEGGDPDNLGYVLIKGNQCAIYLRHYPKCLVHEIRHCYEGNWHEGRDSTEYC